MVNCVSCNLFNNTRALYKYIELQVVIVIQESSCKPSCKTP